ncbi:MAG: zf-HC2 domain-containing protein [Anaerolineales bacterium]
MKHKPYREWMHAVLDGDLAPADRRQFETHLAGCADCQTAWWSLSEAQRLLNAEPILAPRSGFTGRFQARLHQRRSQPRLLWGALALGLGAVGTAAVVVPLGLGFILSVLRAAQQPATAMALFTSLTAVADLLQTVLTGLYLLARALAEAAISNPLAWAGFVLALGLTAVWLVLIRRLVPEGTPQ